MAKKEGISRKMQEHYQNVWEAGNAWDFETSEYEKQRYSYLLDKIKDRHYGRVLEIGCGSGCFTNLLTAIADRVVAVDIAPAAIERARRRVAGGGPGTVEFRVADIMEHDSTPGAPWDLVVLTETIYSLGWLYPFFDIGLFAAQLYGATREGGRCLLANTYGHEKDWLLRPWLIDTYRDLFRNVGFRPESQDIFVGSKEGTEMQVLVTLFVKESAGDPGR
jgi:SAM-dependent methyltransferase